jgi:hypothetical protein
VPSETVFPDRIRLPLKFDPAALAADLAKAEQMPWVKHFNRADYTGDWVLAALRRPVTARGLHPILSVVSDPSCRDWENTEMVEQCPAFKAVLDAFEAPLTSVRLMSLAPGSEIKEHTDLNLSYEDGVVRLHVPIRTHAGVEFYLSGTRVIMQPGECWYLRLSDPHRVVNRGADARVHLVLDIIANAWIGELLARGQSGAAAGG